MSERKSTQEILRAELTDLKLEAEKIAGAIEHLQAALASLGSPPDGGEEARSTSYSVTAPISRRGRKKTAKARRLEEAVLRCLAQSPDGTVTSSTVRLATHAPSHLIAAALRSLEARGVVRDTGKSGPRLAGVGPAPRIYRLAQTQELRAAS